MGLGLADAARPLASRQRQQAALVLRHHVGLGETEIAAILDCRPATVRTLVHRALAALRKELS